MPKLKIGDPNTYPIGIWGLGFVGSYAPCGLLPQTDRMPVIPKNDRQYELPVVL